MSQYYQDEESATLQDVPESPRMTLLATVVGAKRQEARWGKPGSSYLSITVLCESDAGRFKLHGRCPSKVERDIAEARKLGDSKASVVGSLIEFNASIIKGTDNFVTMEDPGSECDIEAHRMMTERYGERVQIVIDDAAVTQMRFIIPFLAAPDRKNRAGNSVLIKLNQAGTFTETCLATEIVLGLADVERVETFLAARKDLRRVLKDLKAIGVNGLAEALDNIKKLGSTAFFSHRSTEGSSEFLPLMPLIYGSVSNKLWFKAGAPNGERNLQNYNPLIRAEEEMLDAGIKTVVANFGGLPDEVTIPAIK